MRKLVIAVLGFVACGGGEPQTPTEPSSTGPPSVSVSIQGRVLDFGTQAGVPGSVVQFAVWSDEQVKMRATTDTRGSYVMTLQTGQYFVSVDGVDVGSAKVTGFAYRGDLLVNGGNCISRYGTLADARTLRPVAGATVSLGLTTVSGPDGWYRLDLGCPSEGYIGYGTTVMYVSHPNYAPTQAIVGRGVQGVERVDLNLQPR